MLFLGCYGSYSSSEASIDLLTISNENLTRQEPQGEETTNAVKSFTDGNPPPGGGNFIPNSYPCSSVVNSSAGEIQKSGNHFTNNELYQNELSCQGGVSDKSSVSGYSASSLIGQLLQNSSEYSHLRDLLQCKMVLAPLNMPERVGGNKAPRSKPDSPEFLPSKTDWTNPSGNNSVISTTGQSASPTGVNGAAMLCNNPLKNSSFVKHIPGNGLIPDNEDVVVGRQNVVHSRIPGKERERPSTAPSGDRERPSTAPSEHHPALAQIVTTENFMPDEQRKKLAQSHCDLKHLDQLAFKSSNDSCRVKSCESQKGPHGADNRHVQMSQTSSQWQSQDTTERRQASPNQQKRSAFLETNIVNFQLLAKSITN